MEKIWPIALVAFVTLGVFAIVGLLVNKDMTSADAVHVATSLLVFAGLVIGFVDNHLKAKQLNKKVDAARATLDEHANQSKEAANHAREAASNSNRLIKEVKQSAEEISDTVRRIKNGNKTDIKPSDSADSQPKS